MATTKIQPTNMERLLTDGDPNVGFDSIRERQQPPRVTIVLIGRFGETLARRIVKANSFQQSSQALDSLAVGFFVTYVAFHLCWHPDEQTYLT